MRGCATWNTLLMLAALCASGCQITYRLELFNESDALVYVWNSSYPVGKVRPHTHEMLYGGWTDDDAITLEDRSGKLLWIYRPTKAQLQKAYSHRQTFRAAWDGAHLHLLRY